MNARGTVLLALALLVFGCKTETQAPGVDNDGIGPGWPEACVDEDSDGFGAHCSRGPDCDDHDASSTNQCYVCMRAAPGCACDAEGQRTTCGKVVGKVGMQTTCASGEMTCTAGTWGECLPDGKVTAIVQPSRHSLGLGKAAPCTGNPCDPYCRQFPDTPDETLSTPGGLLGTDAGLTIEVGDGGARVAKPDGPMPPSVHDTLQEAGLLPAADAGVVYHELLAPRTAVDTIATPSETKSLDVYFLDSTTGPSSDGQSAISTALRSPGGVIDRVKTAVPDAWFGVGRYEQYDWRPWNPIDSSTVAFEHVLSMSSDPSAAKGALAWTRNAFYETGFAAPRSWVSAFFAIATPAGLAAANGYWVLPRDGWSSRANTEKGACPAGRLGYPCFRPSALPITVLVADAPSNNGPGGQYAYVRRDWLHIEGATPWATVPVESVTGNGTENTAQTIDVARFAAYGGSTMRDGVANQSWQWPAEGDCPPSSFSAARNVFFAFHVDARTPFHFDTWGSNFDTALYLYRRGGEGIACNIRHFSGVNTAPNASSLDGAVDPGDYVLVVDGRRGASGDYVLHVNAMPDGAGAPSAAEPNYDEALAAYRSLGGQVVTVDTSGYACDDGPTTFIQRQTGEALDRLAVDTGSLDAQGAPYRVATYPFGGLCHAGDAPPDVRIADAIVGLAKGRIDISAIAVDVDDLVDFDGPPGGGKILTPVNIDDATFVQSISAVATPETMAGCRAVQADRFIGCLPGTRASFQVTFRVPPSVVPTAADQVFTFALRALRNGGPTLSETPVVIVVPGDGKVPRSEAWFVRDYDTSDVCTSGSVPYWGFFAWNARTQGDSRIEFDVAVAPTLAELDAAPAFALLFSDPPGPASLAGQAISVRSGNPNTETGATIVDTTLLARGRPRTSKAMRLRAHLVAAPDRSFAPLLKLWNQSISCQPAE